MIPFHFAASVASQPDDRRVVVPAGLETKSKLLAFLREAIPLPDYFGGNWDALEECLVDLDWLKHSRLILVHEDLPLKKSPAEQRTYLQVLAAAARDSERFGVVFPAADRDEVTRLLIKED